MKTLLTIISIAAILGGWVVFAMAETTPDTETIPPSPTVFSMDARPTEMTENDGVLAPQQGVGLDLVPTPMLGTPEIPQPTMTIRSVSAPPQPTMTIRSVSAPPQSTMTVRSVSAPPQPTMTVRSVSAPPQPTPVTRTQSSR